MGIASLIDEYDGEVSIIGTPAEEGGAGIYQNTGILRLVS